MRNLLFIARSGAALGLFAIVGCTRDFGVFQVSTASSPTADASAGGLAGASGGAGNRDGGTSSGGTSSGGANSGGASSGGTSGSGGAPAAGGAGGLASGGTPGTGGSAGSGGAGGAAGAGGALDAGTSGAGGTDAALTCTSGQKVCGSQCVAIDSPATGCAGAACNSCTLPRVTTAWCVGGACAPMTCNQGFGDCDTTPGDGCERPIRDDVFNCGDCDRACSTAHVSSRACAGSGCTSFCEPGRANCARPVTGADDGCEVDALTNANNCGGCANDCTLQNLPVCANASCGCNAASQCHIGGPPSGITCDVATGLCHCSSSTCVHGEICRQGACSCNGAAACTVGQTCCQTPAGCVDLTTSAVSCGACGHACASGFTCSAGACSCAGDASCNAGAAGTCSAGVCHCGASTCLVGQRCLSNGQCG